MSEKLKKVIPILLAVLLGAGIIFFAIKGDSLFGTKTSFNADGSPSGNSWIDSLKVVSQNSTSKLLGGGMGTLPNSNATTTTDILARDALASAMLYQTTDGASATISNEDAEAVAKNIADNVSLLNPVKRYSRSDITIVPTSTTSFNAYKNELAKALNVFAKEHTMSELLIVAKATDSKDPKKLSPLNTAVQNYKNLITSLLIIKTPEIMVGIHILMIQGYATILSGIEDMQQTFTDPARGMSGITKYQAGMNILLVVSDAFAKMQ